MLTVFCICVGDKYPIDYVYTLRLMVERNLSLPHRFVCFRDDHVPLPFGGGGPVEWQYPPEWWPGWWSKIGLFKPGVATGPSLYLDLDVVITGSLDELVERYQHCELAMPQNWAQSGHGGCQSSLMIWRGNSAHQVWEQFNPEHACWPPEKREGPYWGDQEFITALRDLGGLDVTHTHSKAVVSYKYHCRGQPGPPEGARVVVFHGKPDPHEVSDPWVISARS